MTDKKRLQALEMAARFANIGEDPMISVARAELFYDFLTSLQQSRLERTASPLSPPNETKP